MNRTGEKEFGLVDFFLHRRKTSKVFQKAIGWNVLQRNFDICAGTQPEARLPVFRKSQFTLFYFPFFFFLKLKF